MNKLQLIPNFLVLAFATFAANAQNTSPVAHGVRNDLPQPYVTQRDWGNLPRGTDAWAAVTAVEPSPKGDFIYVIHRCFENSCENRCITGNRPAIEWLFRWLVLAV